MRVTGRLDVIEARVNAATEGPWEAYRYQHGGARIVVEGDPGGRHRALIADVYHAGDREFLLAARTDVPALVAAIRGVLKVHEPMWAGAGYQCVECDALLDDDRPDCPTVAAITAALTEDPWANEAPF